MARIVADGPVGMYERLHWFLGAYALEGNTHDAYKPALRRGPKINVGNVAERPHLDLRDPPVGTEIIVNVDGYGRIQLVGILPVAVFEVSPCVLMCRSPVQVVHDRLSELHSVD